MDTRNKAEEGICILSFDGGGPGSLSQLRMLEELMLRLAFKPGVKVNELHPADYFDLIGGVGFGGLVALLLGRLHMTTSQAMDELAAIGTATFPKDDNMVTREVNMTRLRNAMESMLERHGHPVDIQLHDSSDNRCKVVLFAAPTIAMDHCHAFRTYLAPRKCLECTLVDAACATMAISEYFSSVAIGPRWGKQSFAGIPHGFDNPVREVLKESELAFGETNPVSLVLSLGSGQRARPSDLDQHVTRSSRIHCDSVARGLQYQLKGVAEYLRLNVDHGMENIELDTWSKPGSIITYTNVYLEMNLITKYIDKACQWLRQRNGSVTLGQLNGTKTGCEIMFDSESLKDYLKTEFKQMSDIIQQVDIERITLVDAIGRRIRIPTEFCLTYPMLLDVINLYFKHKKAPGSDFVERGDYRLVHGDRKNIMAQMEWIRVDKAGLKVEMSTILRTRNQNSARCPSCSTLLEGRDIDGWAQCLSCSTQFQIETQVQVEPEANATQSDEGPLMELVTPEVESESSQRRRRERTSTTEAIQLQFRLISVINITAIPFSHPRSQNSARCPSCSTLFEGRDQDGWAQCLSCSTQFQIETQVRVETQLQSEDTNQSDEEPLTESVTPEPPQNPRNQQVGPPRVPSPVIPSTLPLSRYPDKPDRSESRPTTPAGTEGSNDAEQEEDDPTLTPCPTIVRWARLNVPDNVFLNHPDPVRHQLYHQIRQESWFLNQTQERPITGDEASRIPGSLPGESVLLAFYDRVPDTQSNKTVMRCTICMQTSQNAHLYPRPDGARVHMRHHFELRPVPCNGRCNIPHCRQRFFTNGDLNAHVVGKTEPLVKCQFCAKPLRSKNLQRHIDHFCHRIP